MSRSNARAVGTGWERVDLRSQLQLLVKAVALRSAESGRLSRISINVYTAESLYEVVVLTRRQRSLQDVINVHPCLSLKATWSTSRKSCEGPERRAVYRRVGAGLPGLER